MPGRTQRTGIKVGVATKHCFINKDRPCDLTCKAAFPVDDAVDPVDCYFIWLAAHLGDGAIDFRRLLENGLGGLGGFGGTGEAPDSGGPPPKGPHGKPKGPGPFGVSPN